MVAFNGWAEMDDLDSVTVAGHHQKFQIWRTDTSVMYGACPSAPLPLCPSPNDSTIYNPISFTGH